MSRNYSLCQLWENNLCKSLFFLNGRCQEMVILRVILIVTHTTNIARNSEVKGGCMLNMNSVYRWWYTWIGKIQKNAVILELMLIVININESFFGSVIRASDLSCFFQYTASIVMVLLSTAGKKKVWLLSHNWLCSKLLDTFSLILTFVKKDPSSSSGYCQVVDEGSESVRLRLKDHLNTSFRLTPWQSSLPCDLLKNSLQSSMFFILMLWLTLFCIKINCTMTNYIEMMPVSHP